MEKKTFQQFLDESAASLARLAARGIRASGVGRRLTSVRPSVIMSRAERGETWKGVGAKQELAAKINPKSRLYEPSTASRYRSVSKYDKTNTNISGADIRSRNITIARSAAKKAEFKGGSAKNRFDYDAKDKSYTTYPTDKYGDGFSHPKSNTQVDTNITTIPSGRKAAALSSGTKIPVPVRRSAGSRASYRVPSTNEIARKMKEFRRRIVKTGGQERNPVHTVDFIPRRDESGNYGEMDKHAMKVGRNFIKAQRNLAKELKKAGANQGDVVAGGPAAMRTGENTIAGKKRRARMYKKTYGDRVTDLDPTGRVRYMIGAVGGDVKK